MNNYKSKTLRRVRKMIAQYQPTGVSSYDGNPLIEALPPITNVTETHKILLRSPRHFDVKMREQPSHLRYHSIQSASRFFTPLDIHLDLAQRFSYAFREGYVDRNPLQFNYWNDVKNKIDLLSDNYPQQYDDWDDYTSTTAYGFNIIGISGIGKSQIIQHILRTYPQVIYHNKYQGKVFTETQLVWLKLDCPFNGSIKALCINLFQSVDAILGTDYSDKYFKDTRLSAEMMIPDIANVAVNHHLGLLVIDEIQRISYAKSGGKDSMLNFFVQLVNDIGIPVVLAGTYKALEVIAKNLSHLRRASGQGSVVWDRMKFDDQWEYFVKKMFSYSLTRHQPNAKELIKLSQVLYHETQGITDLLIKAFVFSQERAIETGGERITPSIIKSVVMDKFELLQPILRAFREKDKEALINFDDAYPAFIDDLILKGNLTPEKPASLMSIEGEISEEPEVEILIDQKENIGLQSNLIESETSSEKLSAKKPKRSSPQKKKQPKGELLEIVNNSDNDGKDNYSLLKESGLILSTDLFASNDPKQEDLT